MGDSATLQQTQHTARALEHTSKLEQIKFTEKTTLVLQQRPSSEQLFCKPVILPSASEHASLVV